MVLLFAAFVFGLLLGLSNGNQKINDSIVPITGSVSDWVAGIGSLAAVGAAVYFGWKQRDDLLPKLSLRMTGALYMNGNDAIKTMSLRMVNAGHVPIEVRGLFFSSEHSGDALWMHPGLIVQGSDSFVTTLDSGKSASINFDRKALEQLKHYVQQHCNGRTDGLKLTATGAIRDFSITVDSGIPNIQ